MALIYVNSAATGANNGTTKTDAYTSWFSAVTAWNVGDVILIHYAHSESYGVTTNLQNVNADHASPVVSISIDFADDSYRKAITQQIYPSGSFSLNFNLAYYFVGMYFKLNGNSLSSPNLSPLSEFIDCDLDFSGAPSTTYLHCVSDAHYAGIWRYKNCTIAFNPVVLSYLYTKGGSFEFINTTITGYASTNGFIRIDTVGDVTFEGCDLSGVTYGGGILYGVSARGNNKIKFINCKQSASFTVSLSGTNRLQTIENINSDTAGNLDNYEFKDGIGNNVVSDFTIYRNAGYAGIDNPMSLKIIPTSDITRYSPLRLRELRGVVTGTGSKTFSIEIAHDYASLTDADFYFEVLHLGNAGDTLHVLETSLPYPANAKYNPIAAGSALASSAEAWTGAGALTKSTVSKTVTINKAGNYLIRPYLAKYEAGKNIYLDLRANIA